MAKADPLAPRPNLDLSKAVRGKYYDRMKAGTNIVLIAPDPAASLKNLVNPPRLCKTRPQP
jgi:hypothetical protein